MSDKVETITPLARPPKLLTAAGANPKQARDPVEHYELRSVFLSHAGTGEAGINVCAGATEDCITLCLDNGGMGHFPQTLAARKARVKFLAADPEGFQARLLGEVGRAAAAAAKAGKTLAIRLNATSDLEYEALGPELFQIPGVLFYDYTRLAGRIRRGVPSNYVLVLSYSGHNWPKCREYLERGGRVAVVFRAKPGGPDLPSCWNGFPVVDGDLHDRVWERESGAILGLSVKGVARPDEIKADFIVEDW